MDTAEHAEYAERQEEFLFKDEGYRIRGACFNVYRDKGCGFSELVYHDCLMIEFAHQEIPFVYEPILHLSYRGQPLRHSYSPDFLCYGEVVLEIKAVSELTNEHRAQLMNYLKASGKKVGYLINFGHHPKIQIERIVNTR
jgi:GxxExxY protein